MKSKGFVLCLSGDVLKVETLHEANETVTAEFGAVNILINATGGNPPAAATKPDLSFFDLPLDALRHVGDLNLSPMNSFGTPEDLIGATLWLISPAASFVTGVVIPIDGGFSVFSGV